MVESFVDIPLDDTGADSHFNRTHSTSIFKYTSYQRETLKLWEKKKTAEVHSLAGVA